jgi:hypothetical protein
MMIRIFYYRAETDRRPAAKIEKATFVNEGDALIFWNALGEQLDGMIISAITAMPML